MVVIQAAIQAATTVVVMMTEAGTGSTSVQTWSPQERHAGIDMADWI